MKSTEKLRGMGREGMGEKRRKGERERGKGKLYRRFISTNYKGMDVPGRF